MPPIQHPNEDQSNEARRRIADLEPLGFRTYTPSQLVVAKGAGVFYWTPEGRKLYDYTSGVLVANLGHNSAEWQEKFSKYMAWGGAKGEYFEAVPLTAYNAITTVEAEAVRRLTANLQSKPGGGRLQQVVWAASGAEAVQKSLWAALSLAGQDALIVATRNGFHGKKGLAEAVTGNEKDRNRDPRVRFVGFPKEESLDVGLRGAEFDASRYGKELDAIAEEGKPIACLITEPYLGGHGSYHPPKKYLQMLQDFCRSKNALFILDEVQSNFGRTGNMYAFETYGLEPDIVCLGKGLANGAPAAAAVGRKDAFAKLGYGEVSDTYSGNPMACAAVLATLDMFEQKDVLAHARRMSKIIEDGLVKMKELPFVTHVRGEEGGMVWGVEIGEHGGKTAQQLASDCILAAYLGDDKGRAVHMMGPLAGKVLRIAPPLTIKEAEARDSVDCLRACLSKLA